MSSLCKNTRYDHECHPAYARKYDGYCLECHNAGVRDLVEAVPTWQSIETAPKDGTAVLLYGTRATEPGDVARGFMEQHPQLGARWIWDGLWYSDDVPTHWMPLPEPPTQPGDEPGEPFDGLGGGP